MDIVPVGAGCVLVFFSVGDDLKVTHDAPILPLPFSGITVRLRHLEYVQDFSWHVVGKLLSI